MQASKRVIILDNLNSSRISQAIFILSDGASDDFCAIKEAERLIADYLGGQPLSPKKKRKLSLPFVAAVAFSFLMAALAAAALMGLF